ncbi:hypothetical protein ACFYS8_31990 [Kitasatospora sp. NPDC004615]|uniref:hypothetical protein n=1 Tax=Kitasatospora sp. NPDC004615 TaxID=3364017 RepID=UPI00368F661C
MPVPVPVPVPVAVAVAVLIVSPAVAVPATAPVAPLAPLQSGRRELDVGPALGIHLDVRPCGVDGGVHVDADLQPPPVAPVPPFAHRRGGLRTGLRAGLGGTGEHRAHHDDPGERPGRPNSRRPGRPTSGPGG